VSLELKDRAESPVRPRQPDFMEQKNGEKKAAQKENSGDLQRAPRVFIKVLISI